MPLTIRANSVDQGGASSGTLSVPLPADTQIGDSILAVGVAVDDITITGDARLTRLAVLPIPAHSDGGYGEAWVGVATTLDPVVFTYDSTSNAAIGNTTGTVLTTPSEVNTRRQATGNGTADTFTLPALSRRGSGAVMLAATMGAGGHGWGGATDYSGATDGAYYETHYAYTEMDPVESRASSWTSTSGTVTRYAFVLVGLGPDLRLEAHCQNFPRDDRLGVGAAQNYPPPKSQQGGLRNFGYW